MMDARYKLKRVILRMPAADVLKEALGAGAEKQVVGVDRQEMDFVMAELRAWQHDNNIPRGVWVQALFYLLGDMAIENMIGG